jgi:hypothetical protein
LDRARALYKIVRAAARPREAADRTFDGGDLSVKPSKLAFHERLDSLFAIKHDFNKSIIASMPSYVRTARAPFACGRSPAGLRTAVIRYRDTLSANHANKKLSSAYTS